MINIYKDKEKKKSIAVVILNYNGEDWIKPCLQALVDQTDQSFDTFFIDQGSTDNSVKMVRQSIKNSHIIQTGKNLGYTAGSNFGYRTMDRLSKKYDYYLLLGNDAICDKDLIKEIRFLLVKYRHQKIGVIEPTILSKEMVIDMCGGKLSLITGRCNGFLHGQKYSKKNLVYKTFWGCTACALVNTKLLKKVGYNDDYYGYFDDISMCWKFNNLGYKNIATLNTYAIHLGSMTFKSISEFKMFLLSRNRIFTFWQNLSIPMFILLIPIIIIFRIIAILLLTVLGKINIKLLYSGFKGIFEGLSKLKQYKKYNYSIMKDLKTLFSSNHVNLEQSL